MLKKSIAIGALVAASTLLANAETFVSTNNDSTKKDNIAAGNYYGFATKLSSEVVSATKDFPTTGDLYLKDLTLTLDNNSAAGFKLAVYSYTSDGNVGDFLGLSTEAASWSDGGKFCFNFENVTLSNPAGTYQFLFVNGNTTASDLASTDLQKYKDASVQKRVKVWNNSTKLPQGSGTYKANTLGSSSGDWEGSYLPEFTATTTDVIPEPSMFGVLAGLGALALAGARRRRKNVK